MWENAKESYDSWQRELKKLGTLHICKFGNRCFQEELLFDFFHWNLLQTTKWHRNLKIEEMIFKDWHSKYGWVYHEKIALKITATYYLLGILCVSTVLVLLVILTIILPNRLFLFFSGCTSRKMEVQRGNSTSSEVRSSHSSVKSFGLPSGILSISIKIYTHISDMRYIDRLWPSSYTRF